MILPQAFDPRYTKEVFNAAMKILSSSCSEIQGTYPVFSRQLDEQVYTFCSYLPIVAVRGCKPRVLF